MAPSAHRTHYDVLGITPDADAVQVRTAWRLHVQAWHPDRFTGAMREEAERQASAINEAYTVLRDAGRRAAYDCTLAAQERATRPEPAVDRSTRVRPAAPRAATAPVGSPMPLPQPRPFSEQVAVASNEAWSALRRHPRITAAVAATWLLVVGGSVMASMFAGPTLPAGASTAAAASVTPTARIEDAQQSAALDDLAERAEAEHAAAEAALARQLEEQARMDAAEEAADARAAALAAAAAAKVPKGAKASAAAPRAGRVVRVLPEPR